MTFLKKGAVACALAAALTFSPTGAVGTSDSIAPQRGTKQTQLAKRPHKPHRSIRCHAKPYPGPRWCRAAWDSRPSSSPSSTWYIPEAWLREKLARIRSCESGGRYHIATGNGFYGAYQFMKSTWESQGGYGYPHHASPAEQDFRAAHLYRAAGPGPWPVCGSR